MITNKHQLSAISREWMDHARNDLRGQMMAFIEESGATAEQIADMLDVTPDTIENILNGRGNITLDTFAKLLIATDNVIEIKPASAAPRGAFKMPKGGRRGMPQMPRGMHPMMPPMDGGFPMPPMGPDGRPMMPPHGANPRFGGMPGVNSRRGNRVPMGRPEVAESHDLSMLDELGRIELLDIIRQNGWRDEANFDRMTRGQIIDFITMKETPEAAPNANQGLRANRPSIVEDVEEPRMAEDAPRPTAPRASDDHAHLAEMLANAIEENPQLANLIRQYL